MAIGYACTVNGAIRVDTVSPTKRGAMVNGLTTLFGVLVTRLHSDEWIERAYNQFVAQSENSHDLKCVEINVQ
jgi:hypothetical protein